MSARMAVAAAVLALLLLVPLLPAGAQQSSGSDFELDLDRSTFFQLAGREMSIGYTAYNYLPSTGEFTLSCAGGGTAVSPARTVNITGGGALTGNFTMTAQAPGEYGLAITMRLGNETVRALATAVFLPLLSCKFVSPAANGRIGVVGVGQPYTGLVNFTNWGEAPLQPSFSVPSMDLRGGGGSSPTDIVTLQVGLVPPGGSVLFAYNGSALDSPGTRDISPAVAAGGAPAAFGYDAVETGVTNVTAFGFTLAAREMVGVELSEDRFELGRTAAVTMYVESRKFGGIAGGSIDVSVRSDIEARSELKDYAAEPRFEEFVACVDSGLSLDRHFALPHMEPGIQEAFVFNLTPRICRASEEGGSFFLDFKVDLGGTPGSTSKPISVLSPLEISLSSPEKVSYAGTGDRLARRMTVRNISNSTIAGASAYFFLDFRQNGFVNKQDIAETPSTPLPRLAPGESTEVTLPILLRSPGIYTFFPMVSWDGLSVYGSHIQVVASAPGGTPVGPYIAAMLVIIIPAALTRRMTPG